MYRCTIKKVQYSYVNMFSFCENILLMQPLQKLFLLLYAILQKLFLSLYMPYFRNCFYRYLPYFRNCYIPYFRNCFYRYMPYFRNCFYRYMPYFSTAIYLMETSRWMYCKLWDQKRRIYTEEKANVLAAAWGIELIKCFLAARTILHQDDLKIRMNSSYSRTRMIWRSGCIHPIFGSGWLEEKYEFMQNS